MHPMGDGSDSFWRSSMGDFGVALFDPLGLWSLPSGEQQTAAQPLAFSSPPSSPQKTTKEVSDWSGAGDDDDTAGETNKGDSSSAFLSSEDESAGGVVDDSDREEQEDSSFPKNSYSNRNDGDNDDDSWILLPEPDAELQACPRLLTLEHVRELRQHLPTPLLRSYTWERRFAIGLHGDSFRTLVQTCQDYAHTVVVMRTTRGELLGGFASEPWRTTTTTTTSTRSSPSPQPTSSSSSSLHRRPARQRRQQSAYYGTGQSFVFASHPAVVAEPPPTAEDNNQDKARTPPLLHVYPWTGQNDYCQICDSQRRILCMGGVGEFGWIVSDDFTVGRTGHCATFGNPPLTTTSTMSFAIADLEIYGLASPLLWYTTQWNTKSSSSTAITTSTSSLGTTESYLSSSFRTNDDTAGNDWS